MRLCKVRLSGKERGFTLIELMLAVALVVILASIAIPQYTQFKQRGYRAEGKAMLLEVAAKQEQYFMDNRVYADAMTELGYAHASEPTENNAYTVSINAATVACPLTNCFVATATAAAGGPQVGEVCGNYSINSRGQKFPVDTDTVRGCW